MVEKIGDRNECIRFLLNQNSQKIFEISEHKQTRSLNANAYFHLLVNKIAKALKRDNTEVKIEENLKYGTLARTDDGGVMGCKVPKNSNIQQIYEYAKWYKEDDGYDCYLFYKRTSWLNSEEMAHLIDGVVSDCKELGIETLPEEEIESLVKSWERTSGL